MSTRASSFATTHPHATMAPSTTETSSTLLTVEQTAEAMNVSVRFVRRLIAERRIAVHRLGRHVRIDRADVDAFVANGRTEAHEPARHLS